MVAYRYITDQIELLEEEKIVHESPKDKVLIQEVIDKLMNQYGITDHMKIEKTREEIIKEREEDRKEIIKEREEDRKEMKDWMAKTRDKGDI